LLKTAALGYAIAAASKIKMSESDIKKFIEEMRYQVMSLPEQLALNEFFDYDSKVHKISS
jgi:hypothetical protein